MWTRVGLHQRGAVYSSSQSFVNDAHENSTKAAMSLSENVGAEEVTSTSKCGALSAGWRRVGEKFRGVLAKRRRPTPSR